jgi:vitamin B12 transporter
VRQQQLLNSFWLAGAVAVLVAQPVRADVTQVTAVRLNRTPSGIQVILETAGGTSSQVFTSSYGHTFAVDIINTQLRLSDDNNTFRQDNPTDEVAWVSVTSLDATSIRVVVTGKTGVPIGQVMHTDRGFVLSLTATPDPTAAQINPTSTSPPTMTPAPSVEADDTPEEIEANEAAKEPEVQVEGDELIELEVTGTRDPFPQTSTPVYEITEEEIQQQKPNSLAEILRVLPGFAVNDVGFGADIHTGTYYRGQSINQSVYLLNGRPINTNINTYHGATDLNSIPVDAIERVELSSGTSSTLYGSEAFGGVVNVITKQGDETPKFNGLAEFGSYDQSNYRGSYGGSLGSLKFNFGYEEYSADNRYRVPVGAANRDSEGFLFNGDTATSNYYGSATLDLDSRNTLSLDAYKISSRRGLLYFGFPLQRDRLDHDVFNVGLSWRTLLGGGEDSILKTTLSYNQDYFNTYGPTQNIFFRTGTLNSQALNARVEHDWQLTPNNNLRWGIDLQNSDLNGDVLSTAPDRTALNETENRDRFHTALFALNTWKISDRFQADFGLRQNFNSEFGSYLNPSAGLRWAASSKIAVRGSWAEVQRNPGLDQLYILTQCTTGCPTLI